MDILCLSAQSAWLAIIVSTKVTLAGFSNFEHKNEGNVWALTMFKKHMMDLQNNAMIPATMQLLNQTENTPKHLTDPIEKFKESSDQDIMILHLNLLNASSDALMKLITEVGVGPKTYTEICNWFLMMKKLSKIKSFWIGIERSAKAVFVVKINSFKKITLNDELSIQEYPFFSSKCLLIQVAYSVDYLTFNHAENTCKYHTSLEEYQKWETISGDICNELIFHDITFGLDEVVLSQHSHDDDDTQSNEEYRSKDPLFIWMQLPYNYLLEKKSINDHNIMKSPLEVHRMVMDLMIIRISKIMDRTRNGNSQDHKIVRTITNFISNHEELIERRLDKMNKRTKASKNEEKERKKKERLPS
jgi:hypothetical protein